MESKEQIEQIKDQLLEQLDSFPEDKREFMKEKITSLSDEDFMEFLKQNKLLESEQKCIFCSIIENKTPCYKIGENKENIAILEINPLSKGHSLIIPKNHLEKVQNSANQLAKEISEKLQVLNPDKINIKETKILEHALIEIIPEYSNEKLEKKQASKQELQELQKTLTQPIKVKEQIEKPKQEQVKQEVKIPRLKPRIP